jgi:uncharacterized protein (TIGR02145 family)
MATFAGSLLILVACQNATESNSSSDSPVVATVTFPITAPRIPDSAIWIFLKDTVVQRPNCPASGSDGTANCTETFDLPRPLGTDSVALQLWTLGIQTYTLYFKESGSSTTLDYGSASVESLDTLLLSRFAKLTSAQKAALLPSDTGSSGLVAYYASLILSTDTAFAGKSFPVGMSADSIRKYLVLQGIAGAKTSAQLTALNLGLDTASIRSIAGILVRANLLKPTDTLDWFHPIRVSGAISLANSLTAGGAAVGVSGSISWNAGVPIVLSQISVRTSRGGADTTDFRFPTKQFNPGPTDTLWNLSGNLTVQAGTSAPLGWDTLVISLSNALTVRVPFQVVAKDVTPPALTLVSPVHDTATVPNSTSTFVVQAVATDSGSGVDSLKIGMKTRTTSASIADTLWDTLSLVVGANVATVQAWDHAGNVSTATVILTRAPAPANTKPPSITHVSPSQDTETVPWGTKSTMLSWAIAGDTAITAVTLNGRPLSGHAGLYQDTAALGVGQNLFALAAVDAYGLSAYDTLRITRQGDASHPVVSRGLGTDDTVLLQSQSTWSPIWTVTDNALDSVTINGIVVTGGNGNTYSAPVPLSGDSLWVTLMAKDSSGNTTRDSIQVRRLGPPTISPAGGTLSGTQTVTPQISSNLPGATLSYSNSINPSLWTVGSTPFVSTNQVLYAKATVGNVTSHLDSAVFLYIPSPTLSGITATQATVTLAPAGAMGLEDSLNTGSTWNSYAGSFSVSANTKVFARSHLGGLATVAQEVDFAIPPTLVPASKDTGVDSVLVTASSPGADSVQVSLNQQKWFTVSKAAPSYPVSANGTLYGRSWVGNAVSALDSVPVQIYPSAPQFTVASGTYPFAQTARMTTIPSGASIHYTTDGSAPTIHSPLYSDSVVVGTSKTLKAIAANGLAVNGVVDSATYMIADTNTYGIPWNRNIAYGTLMDARDSQIYRTVKIGAQTWMAQNLDFNVSNTSFCYNDSANNCLQFGRLYSTALTGPSLCPNGWHVPNDTEWNRMINFVDSSAPGTELKSGMGWDSAGNGIDSYGFRALPGGDGEVLDPAATSGSGKEITGLWWSSTYDLGSGHEYFWGMSYQSGALAHNTTRDYECSIRCMQDP